MPAKHLPHLYYALSQVGKAELDALSLGPEHYALGLTRSGFLFAQMETASTLGTSVYTVDQLPFRRSRAAWRRNLAPASGFCYLKLFQYEWVVPALCVLGAFPDAADVAKLSPYFRSDRSLSSWGVFVSGSHRSRAVTHVVGVDRLLACSVESKLVSFSGSMVGSAFPHLPSLPPRPVPPVDSLRPFPPRPLQPLGVSDPSSSRPIGRDSGGRGGRACNKGRYFDAPTNDDRRSSGNKRNTFVPFQPYSTDAGYRCRGSPSAVAQAWKSAASDELDSVIDSLKSELPKLPRSVSDPLWDGFLSWFQELKKSSRPFSRVAAIPVVQWYFASIFEPALEAAQQAAAEDAQLPSDDLEAKGMELSRLSVLVSKLEKDLVNPPVGGDPADIEQALIDARAMLSSLDDEIDALEAGAVPPTMADGSIADGASFVPVDDTHPVVPWTESNFENYVERTAPLFPNPVSKVPLESLLVRMEEKSDSKILLPRPLELYTEAEINSAKPKSRAAWFNHHEDSLEVVKCWSLETFTRVYSQPGFHFMLARTAQNGPQTRDPKLPSLRSRLSARWDCPVEFSAMLPRQDWMLCTIPDVSGPRTEILSTALMRLSDGNASYIVRHFSAVSHTRDLTFTVKGTRDDGNSVYNQLRKRLLEFESRGVSLGWCVLGVRKTNAPFVFRGTFILDSPSVFWPWTMGFDHAHGSINPLSPLLNFDPPWMARKPYACQTCYSSTHVSYKCPLPAVHLRGVLVVSHTSHESMLNKKAAERLIVIDRSLLPKKPTPDPLGAPPPRVRPAPRQNLPVVREAPDFVDSIASFLALKLYRFVGDGPGKHPMSIISRAAECGSLSGALAMVSDYIPIVASWSFEAVNLEFIGWSEGTLIPGSASSIPDEKMSDAPELEYSESSPAPVVPALPSCTSLVP